MKVSDEVNIPITLSCKEVYNGGSAWWRKKGGLGAKPP